MDLYIHDSILRKLYQLGIYQCSFLLKYWKFVLILDMCCIDYWWGKEGFYHIQWGCMFFISHQVVVDNLWDSVSHKPNYCLCLNNLWTYRLFWVANKYYSAHSKVILREVWELSIGIWVLHFFNNHFLIEVDCWYYRFYLSSLLFFGRWDPFKQKRDFYRSMCFIWEVWLFERGQILLLSVSF